MAKASEPKLRPTVKPIKRGEVDAPSARNAPEQAAEGRVASGIPGLDSLIGGGFEEESNVLVLGDAGSGKTTFLCQYLHNGAKEYEEPGVLITFEESADRLFKHMQKFGMDFPTLEGANLFATVNYRPHEVRKLIEEGGGLILDTLSSLGAKRLAIDSFTSYVTMFDTAYNARESELEFYTLLRKWKCTTLLSAEAPLPKRQKTASGMDSLADGVIRLYHPRHQDMRFRALEILKMRGVKKSERAVPFDFIEGAGIRVYPNEQVFFELKERDD